MLEVPNGTCQHGLNVTAGRKKLPWHIDYLSVKTEILGAITTDGPRELECQLAKKLGGMFELAARGFGASDCRCKRHLFYAPQF